MKRSQSSDSFPKTGNRQFLLMLVLLLAVLSVVMGRSYLPGQVLFSNDGPLGRLMSECHRLPERFTGCWEDLNSIGYREGGSPPGITSLLQLVLRPIGFAKFYAPIALLMLGLSAWYCFRRLGLAPIACILGGLAATLDSSFFSAACWGVASHPITVAMSFLALAALADVSSPRHWLRAPLAGLAVGVAVIEGADIGALFSLFIAAFLLYQPWAQKSLERPISEPSQNGHPNGPARCPPFRVSDERRGPFVRSIPTSLARLALVALCAALVASDAVSDLLHTNLKDVVKAGEREARTKAERWDWATQWSLPKREVLSLFVPGLFGYRGDTPDGGEYWGAIGRDPAWDRYVESGGQGTRPAGFTRYSGGGFYAGLLVMLVALWGVVQSGRGDSGFNLSQRKFIWFCLGASVASLLLAFGRFAPFYQLIYHLPFFSSIRNPTKFLHIFSFALLFLFAYGMDCLCRKHMSAAGQKPRQPWAGFSDWWAKAATSEKLWVFAFLSVLSLSSAGWAAYSSHAASLVRYLVTVQVVPSHAPSIALFSIGQVRWFLLFFGLSAGLLVLVFSGAFSGGRAGWGGVLLGALLVIDLARANQPWIQYLDYKQAYASDPIIDLLRDKPYEHRVAVVPLRLPRNLALFEGLYRLQWAQYLFPYYNVQSLNIVQMPRKPADLAAFEDAFKPAQPEDLLPAQLRNWQLTNTRYLVGAADFQESLERKHPMLQQFRIAALFDMEAKPEVISPTKFDEFTTVLTTNGPYALFEFIGALPRARLYSDWQISTNQASVLQSLTNASFDPKRTVLISADSKAQVPPVNESAPANTNASRAEVAFATYTPKRMTLKTEASAPEVLLLNDRFDPNWKVFVDGKAEALLRCNYIMRGVFLASGAHTVEFRFQPPLTSLYVSLGAITALLILLGFVVLTDERRSFPARAAVPQLQPGLVRPQPKVAGRNRGQPVAKTKGSR